MAVPPLLPELLLELEPAPEEELTPEELLDELEPPELDELELLELELPPELEELELEELDVPEDELELEELELPPELEELLDELEPPIQLPTVGEMLKPYCPQSPPSLLVSTPVTLI